MQNKISKMLYGTKTIQYFTNLRNQIFMILKNKKQLKRQLNRESLPL